MLRRGNLQSHEPNRQNSERLDRISSIWPHFNAQKVDIFRSVVLGDRLLLWRPDRAVFMSLVQAFTWSVFSFSSQIRRMYMSLHVNVFARCQCVRGVSAQPVDRQEVVSGSRKMAVMTMTSDCDITPSDFLHLLLISKKCFLFSVISQLWNLKGTIITSTARGPSTGPGSLTSQGRRSTTRDPPTSPSL